MTKHLKRLQNFIQVFRFYSPFFAAIILVLIFFFFAKSSSIRRILHCVSVRVICTRIRRIQRKGHLSVGVVKASNRYGKIPVKKKKIFIFRLEHPDSRRCTYALHD